MAMARELLDNVRWSFGTNCYVCGPDNALGLVKFVPFAGSSYMSLTFLKSLASARPRYAPR